MITTTNSDVYRVSADELLTPYEAGALLGLQPSTIRVWMRQGKLPRVEIGHKTVRTTRGAVEALIQAAEQSGTGSGGAIATAIHLSPRTSTLLHEQAATAGQDADTLADVLLTDALEELRDTVAGLRRGIDAARAGNAVDLDDHIAEVQEMRRRRDAQETVPGAAVAV